MRKELAPVWAGGSREGGEKDSTSPGAPGGMGRARDAGRTREAGGDAGREGGHLRAGGREARGEEEGQASRCGASAGAASSGRQATGRRGCLPRRPASRAASDGRTTALRRGGARPCSAGAPGKTLQPGRVVPRLSGPVSGALSRLERPLCRLPPPRGRAPVAPRPALLARGQGPAQGSAGL